MNYKNVIKYSIHLFFWLFYITIVFFLMPDFGEGDAFLSKIDYKILFIVLALTYLNDLLLLPYFFKRRKYVLYIAIILTLIVGTTALYCQLFFLCSSCTLAVCMIQIWKFLLPVLFLSLIWILMAFFENQKKLEETQKNQIEMELKFLKSQINPHVLFNNLNTLYAEAIKKSDNVAEMILMLSDNLKYILYQSETKMVALEKDINFIENYLEFQKLRTKGINKIIFNKNVDSYQHQIAPLLLIGLIENAFKHSSFKDDALSDIIIELKIIRGRLYFKCSNELDQNSGTRNIDGFQIGLKNMKKRLNLIYPNGKHHFYIVNEKNQFIANLEITL